VNTVDYLANVVAVARDGGFTTKSQAEINGGTSTSASAYSNYRIFTNRAKHEDWYVAPSTADHEYAQRIFDHVRGLTLDGANDYISNLIIAMQAESNARNTGLLASAYLVFKRFLEGEAKRKESAKSEHVGMVGAKKVRLSVQVVSVRSVESRFGTTFKHLMKSGNDTIIWWCSSYSNCLNEGVQYEISCTIKDHGEWQGAKQTTISYVKVVG
jgi:hypothetical protein